MLQKVQQSNHYLIKFVICLPSFSQNWKANVSLLINVGMENLIETFNFRLRKRVICRSFVGKCNFWMSINCVLCRLNCNVEFSDFTLIRESDFNVRDFVFLISLEIFHHSLISSLWNSFLLLFCLLLNSLLLEILKHLKKINFIKNYKSFILSLSAWLFISRFVKNENHIKIVHIKMRNAIAIETLNKFYFVTIFVWNFSLHSRHCLWIGMLTNFRTKGWAKLVKWSSQQLWKHFTHWSDTFFEQCLQLIL